MFVKFRCSRPEGPDRSLPAVVVVFGWVGSNMRHVQKYAEMLVEQGVEEVWCAIASRSDLFLSNTTAVPAIARRTLEHLQVEAHGKPSAVYCFSNGGAMVYQYLWQQLAADSKLPDGKRKYAGVRLVASLFDSAPVDLSIATASRACSDSIASQWQRTLVFYIAMLLMPLLALLFMPGGLRAEAKYREALLADSLPGAQLYIYSYHDTLTDHEYLSGFIAERRTRHVEGADAVQALFIDKHKRTSPHCGHMRAHPELYRETVKGFLKHAVEDHKAKL